jgi:predicted PhzF superfamily epimerase YddE/YHI9
MVIWGQLVGERVASCLAEDDEAHDIAVRFWAPGTIEWEDPVTGSSFAVAGPYWAKRLGKSVLAARQCSARGGELECHVDEQSQRVKVTGRCALAVSGKLHLP